MSLDEFDQIKRCFASHSSPRFRYRKLLIGLVVAASVGCGAELERVPVSGQVLIDGEPLTKGSVIVLPAGARQAWGELDEEGRFSLTTFESGDGVPLGTHVVLVNGAEMLNRTETKWHAPPKYSIRSNKSLKLTVEGETDSALIELSWDGGKPHIQRVPGIMDPNARE